MKFLYLFLLLFCISCEKTVNIQPENQSPLLVVDGSIENGKAPYIVLSKSVNYFSEINLSILAASVVSGATITLSDGINTSQLKEYVQQIAPGYSFNYYTNDSLNPSAAILGEEGKTYKLTIQYNNAVYTAVTSIPRLTKTLDSIWWTQAPHNDDTTKAVLMGKFTDPVGFGNYIRYWTKVGSENFLPGANSVFDDQVIDGQSYTFQVDQGIDRNNPPDGKDYGFFHHGDSVMVKFANIDKGTFDYWRTLEFSYQTQGNPFSSPTKVINNVSNGALGAFCGYACMYRRCVIP